MNIIDLINKKRLGNKLSYEEIKYIVTSFMNNSIKDYQMSSLLMAICIKGMDNEEIVNLTRIMLDSGNKLDLSSVPGIKVDKHSTGGVGDKTTLIVAPLVASCGVIVPKMSGRGLGHTGGTIDKLEAIAGFNVFLSKAEFLNQLKDLGVAITTSTQDFVPADKKIYALRDVTGTVSSPALIAASIMSKKLATGADKIVLDVKTGQGAFMATKEEAIELAKIMVNIGNSFGKQTIAIISNMSYPLGNNIGNGIEVLEAIEILKGQGNVYLKELCVTLASYMVSLGKNISYEEARGLVITNLTNGVAFEKFKELVKRQRGNLDDIKISRSVVEVKASQEGYINDIDALKVGEMSMALGAGRREQHEMIDYGVGIVLTKTIGDYVKVNDVIAKVYFGHRQANIEDLKKAFVISPEPTNKEPLIYGTVK